FAETPDPIRNRAPNIPDTRSPPRLSTAPDGELSASRRHTRRAPNRSSRQRLLSAVPWRAPALHRRHLVLRAAIHLRQARPATSESPSPVRRGCDATPAGPCDRSTEWFEALRRWPGGAFLQGTPAPARERLQRLTPNWTKRTRLGT